MPQPVPPCTNTHKEQLRTSESLLTIILISCIDLSEYSTLVALVLALLNQMLPHLYHHLPLDSLLLDTPENPRMPMVSNYPLSSMSFLLLAKTAEEPILTLLHSRSTPFARPSSTYLEPLGTTPKGRPPDCQTEKGTFLLPWCLP